MRDYDDAELQELIDRKRVYDVLTRYCRALDRCDVNLMRSVYWDDARDDHGVFNGGAQEFAEFIIREIQEWFEVTMHAIMNVHMELKDNIACTESYLFAYHRIRGDKKKSRRFSARPIFRNLIGRRSKASRMFFTMADAMWTASKNAERNGRSRTDKS